MQRNLINEIDVHEMDIRILSDFQCKKSVFGKVISILHIKFISDFF